MKRQTRSLLLNLAAGAAIAAATAVILMPSTAMAQVGFNLEIGPGGPKVTIGTPVSGEVCFFSRTNYRGDSFCVDEGTTIRDLDDWAGEISSLRNPDGLDVTLCTRTRLRSPCVVYSSSARSIGKYDDEVESIRVD